MDHLDYVGIFGPAKDPPPLPEPTPELEPAPAPAKKTKKKPAKRDVSVIGRWN